MNADSVIGTEVLALVILLVIIYNFNKTFRLFVRYVAINISFAIAVCSTLPVAFCRGKTPKNIETLSTFQRWLFKPYRISVAVITSEDGVRSVGGVITLNHQSAMLDPFLFSTIAKDIGVHTLVTKKGHERIPLFGWLLTLGCSVFVDKDRAFDSNLQSMSEGSLLMVRDQVKLLICPEGRTNSNGNFLSFKKGGFRIAVDAQAPIFPVVFSYYSHIFSRERRIFGRGEVIASLLPRIKTRGLKASHVDELTTRVRTLMMEEYLRISDNLPSDVRSPMELEVSKANSQFYKLLSEAPFLVDNLQAGDGREVAQRAESCGSIPTLISDHKDQETLSKTKIKN